MTLTPDEKALLAAYRKARSRRKVLHVVCQEAVVSIYTLGQEAKQTIGKTIELTTSAAFVTQD